MVNPAAGAEILEALTTVDDLTRLFELQHRLTMAAVEAWRKDHPEATTAVFPDLGELMGWLLEKAGVTQP